MVRSLAALCGGLVREIGVVALPPAVRKTALYRMIVEVTLRFLIVQVGQVEGVYANDQRNEGQLAKNFLLKRGASHGLELLGYMTLHVSPIWVLAALADATGAGHALIQQIAAALKDEELLERTARFETLDQILDGLEKTSRHLAETVNLPPLEIAELRTELRRFRDELPMVPALSLPRLEDLERVWTRVAGFAAVEERSVFAVCSLLAISTVSHLPANLLWLSRAAHVATMRTGEVLGEALLLHYLRALDEISQTGFVEYWRREFRPYLRAAAEQFTRNKT